ncbi:putative cytochrome P450 49a1 [Chionoecetes opilio]|uniref:Putative cytochrome P450 49a1 n=1 Tax=Chionoecetes opilio TaxID=41210 RepID=A0A8J5CQN3_CHIOP|nr:putative cytochrome P450 49a1 [Chionoecetes opilio]
MRRWVSFAPCCVAGRGMVFLRGVSSCPRPRQPQLDRPMDAPAYLEAYELMEENADVIFEPKDMMSERAYEGTGGLAGQPRPASHLPGPRAWPIVGCLPYMLRHPAFDPDRVYLFWQAVREEFGPIFRKDMPGHRPLVFITQPEDVETLLRATLYNPLRPGMASLKHVRRDGGADGKHHAHDCLFQGRAGILAEQGQEWWRVRRAVQRPLTASPLVARYLAQMDAVAKDFVARIRHVRDQQTGEVPDTFNTELYKWSLESLGTIALDRRLGCLQQEGQIGGGEGDGGVLQPLHLIHAAKQLLRALHETENVKLWQYFPTDSIMRLQEAHQVFTETDVLPPPSVALEAIRATEKQETTQRQGQGVAAPDASLLGTLLAMPGLSREDVLTFILDLIATGIDTTSHAVGNLLYLLARHPHVQQRVQDEVTREVGRPEHLRPEHLVTLPYTKAVFRESLRLMPVNVGLVRTLTHDTVLGGYLVPRGWQVVAPTMLLHHREDVFPRAKEFLPERFLRGSPWAPRHNFAFLPFSYGTRMCIGRKIAYQEIFCFLIRVLGEMHVQYTHEDVHLVNRLSYGPSCPLRFTFTDRP